MSEGIYDQRNKLNDLTGKNWLKLTKSYWKSEKCAADKDAFGHPAPFLIKDTKKLISMFTKEGMMVLDPFCGSGTTLIAAAESGRQCIGIDLSDTYKELATYRLTKCNLIEDKDYQYIVGDSLKVISKICEVDYIVTSPPYHNILKNKGQGLRKKSSKEFRTGSRDGVEYYSEESNDLGNLESYKEFISQFKKIMRLCYKKLKNKKYCTIVISDFTVNKKEVCVQGDIVKMAESVGFEFSGTTILLQDSKPLYPFGYPYAYKINHHHQNLITFRKVVADGNE
jgi:DNA modification methylase